MKIKPKKNFKNRKKRKRERERGERERGGNSNKALNSPNRVNKKTCVILIWNLSLAPWKFCSLLTKLWLFSDSLCGTVFDLKRLEFGIEFKRSFLLSPRRYFANRFCFHQCWITLPNQGITASTTLFQICPATKKAHN